MKSLKIDEIIREAIESRIPEIRRSLKSKRELYLNEARKGRRHGKR